MILNNLNNSGDLRSKLRKPRKKIQYRDPIQVVITNTSPKLNSLKRDNSSEIAWRQDQVMKKVELSETEEGECQESEDENDNEKEDEKIEQYQHRQYTLMNDDEEKKEEGQQDEEEKEEQDEDEEEEEQEKEEEKNENREDEEDSAAEDNMRAKEVQGPKGSVIKVVPPRPRVASTVWARLNHMKSEISDSYLKNR